MSSNAVHQVMDGGLPSASTVHWKHALLFTLAYLRAMATDQPGMVSLDASLETVGWVAPPNELRTLTLALVGLATQTPRGGRDPFDTLPRETRTRLKIAEFVNYSRVHGSPTCAPGLWAG